MGWSAAIWRGSNCSAAANKRCPQPACIAGRRKLHIAKSLLPPFGGSFLQRVEFLDTLQKGQQPRTAAPKASLKISRTPRQRRFFRQSALIFLGIHKVFLQKIALIGKKSLAAGRSVNFQTSPSRLFPFLGTPSTKFYGKSRTRSLRPRTQFTVKFPCMYPHRRRMSADADGF